MLGFQQQYRYDSWNSETQPTSERTNRDAGEKLDFRQHRFSQKLQNWNISASSTIFKKIVHSGIVHRYELSRGATRGTDGRASALFWRWSISGPALWNSALLLVMETWLSVALIDSARPESADGKSTTRPCRAQLLHLHSRSNITGTLSTSALSAGRFLFKMFG